MDFSFGGTRDSWFVEVGVYGGGEVSYAKLLVAIDAEYDGGSLRPGGKILSTLDI